MAGAFANSLTAAGKALGEHQKAFDKLAKEEHARWAKTSADANKIINTNVSAGLDIVSKLIDDNDNYVQQANEMYTAMIDARQAADDALEQAYVDARKAVDAILAQRKKLEDDCNKLDDTLRKTITDMQKQAIKASQDKLADALAGSLKTL